MNKYSVLIICLLLPESERAGTDVREVPYYLKGYEAEYAKSPKEAALAWFKDARFGLFIHWEIASLYGKGEWVMYNEAIPYKEYEQKAEFKGEI